MSRTLLSEPPLEMMALPALLETLAALEVEWRVSKGRLSVRDPAHALTEELKKALVQHKPALLRSFDDPPANDPRSAPADPAFGPAAWENVRLRLNQSLPVQTPRVKAARRSLLRVFVEYMVMSYDDLLEALFCEGIVGYTFADAFHSLVAEGQIQQVETGAWAIVSTTDRS